MLSVAIPYKGSTGPLHLLVPLMVCKQTTAGQRMHCVKVLSQRLSARDFDRQVAEIQIRAAILNGFKALGIPRTVTLG
jgi:hypothetical protein